VLLVYGKAEAVPFQILNSGFLARAKCAVGRNDKLKNNCKFKTWADEGVRPLQLGALA
jgi:hypothetical protein